MKNDRPKPTKPKPARRVTGSSNTNTDAFPHDAICPPKSLMHPEDGSPKRS